jgi:Fe/S biogenesis protein NfuA
MSDLVITEDAVSYLEGLLEKQPEGTNVRLYITDPGTPRAETCLAFCKPGHQKPDDQVRNLGNATLFVEALSLGFLEDACIDFSKDRLGGQLTIKAPNAKLPQLSDDSPVEDRINYYLQTEVNPGLASHGGFIQLVAVEDDVAILEFGGGCQGCGMVDVTLKDGVEKTLLERVPELKAVRDVTDHTDRSSAYI